METTGRKGTNHRSEKGGQGRPNPKDDPGDTRDHESQSEERATTPHGKSRPGRYSVEIHQGFVNELGVVTSTHTSHSFNLKGRVIFPGTRGVPDPRRPDRYPVLRVTVLYSRTTCKYRRLSRVPYSYLGFRSHVGFPTRAPYPVTTGRRTRRTDSRTCSYDPPPVLPSWTVSQGFDDRSERKGGDSGLLHRPQSVCCHFHWVRVGRPTSG